jgi:outer membrane protein assembly factor BamB
MTEPEGRRGFTLGVDLGTSHTVAMLRWPDGRTRPLLFDGQPLLPSAVYLDTGGRLHVGRDAQRLGYADPARIEPHPKRHIDAESVLLAGTGVPVADLFAALLGGVAREAVATAGFLPPAVLTYPAAWGARRRTILTEAVGKAGWPAQTRLVAEPVAAARYFSDVLRRPVPVGSALAVFDFGGGTLDVAVVRNEGFGPDGQPRFEVASCGGADDLGGLDLDASLVDHLGKALAGGEPGAWGALTDPTTLAQWRARRQFWDDVRGAKEMLSRAALAPVPVPGVENAVHVTRDELEGAAGPLIRRGVAEAGTVIKAAGLTPAELAGLFLVGGSSRVPLVARLLHSELGIAPTVLEQPELPVAEGAIVVATHPAPAEVPAAAESPATSTAPAELAATAPAPAVPASTGPAPAVSAPTGPAPAVPASTGPAPAVSVPAGPAPAASGPAGPGPGVRFQPGHAAAATPPPTADTVPNAPPPPSAPATPAPQYAEPVDPWATGEAAAFAASGGAPPYFPSSGAPAGHTAAPSPPDPTWLASAQRPPDRPVKAYRKKWFWLVAAAVVVVLGAGATLAVIFWPGYPALDYRPLTESKQVSLDPAVPVGFTFSDTAMIGNRVYFASASDQGLLGVVAADADTGKEVWKNTNAGSAERWDGMVALPTAVAVFTDTDSTTSTSRMAVLGAQDGRLLWQRTLGGDDGVYFSGSVAVLVDRVAHRLVGLRLADGTVAWQKPNPATDSGTSTAVYAATTSADLTGPATLGGVAFQPDADDDQRLVQISADRSVRVIDAATGDVVKEQRQPGIADTNSPVLAHDGRLIVAETNNNAQRILAYDLDKLGEPDVLASLPGAVRASRLTPCGGDRVCWIETTGYDTKMTRVAGINVTDGSSGWRTAVAGTDDLVPVGDHLLTSQDTSPPTAALLDAKGKVAWTANGVAARLDGGNVLLFSKAPTTSPDDPSVSGRHLGDGEQPLGPLRGVRSATCSWNTSTIACVAEDDFRLQRFTG